MDLDWLAPFPIYSNKKREETFNFLFLSSLHLGKYVRKDHDAGRPEYGKGLENSHRIPVDRRFGKHDPDGQESDGEKVPEEHRRPLVQSP